MRQPTGDNTLAGYVRQSSADITPTATLRAAPINAEYNKLRDAFAVSSGHKHDGSTGEGGYVSLIADVDALNKIVVNTSTNQIGVFVQVSSSTVEQLRFSDGAIIPVTDNDIDLGTASLEFKDLYLDGTAHIDTLDVDINGAVAGTFTIGSTLGVTGTTTLSTANITTGVITSVDINSGAIDNVTIGGTTAGAGSFTTLSATGTATLATVDINAGAIDGTTIGASSASPATVTDLTATGTSTLTTVDINAGNIDNTVIGASTAVAGSFTTVTTSGQATLATVDINGGNIDGAIIGASATAAITGTTITGSSLVGPLTGNVSGNTAGVHTGNVTGNVTGNITASSGTSTLNNLTVNGTLDVTGTTIANVTNPTNAQDAATKNYVDSADALKLNLSGGTMSGAIAMGGSKVTGLGNPSASTDAANKAYVDSEVSALVDSSPAALNTLNELAAAINDDASFSTTITNSIATKLPKAGGTMTGDIVMGSNAVTSTANPASDNELSRKAYVDTQDATKLNLSGGTMSGAIAMGTSKITGLGNPTANQDASTKAYVDTTALLKAGGTMSGVIAMGSNKITGLTNPTANQDAATKAYVDNTSASNTAAASSATAAATSENNAATSATNASNSASSASSSATSAAASLDSFDDRYLGAKSSAPSVDNDGNSLITGALYFNTSSNIMFVRSSAGGWQAAGSSVNGTSSRNTYTANANQTTFSATYDAGYVDIFLNGVKLLVGTDVTASNGSAIVLATGATAGDIVDIVGYGTFELADHYNKTASDARFLGLAGGTMTGDINGNGNKVLFGNVYSQVSDLPSASTYHGMFAHVHATGKGYFAHAGNWVVLANDTEKLNLSGGTMTGNLDVGGSVEFDSLSGTGSVSITDILDEDNMASNSATALATQQSIKAYTDASVAGLIDSSPSALNTLNELAAALGDDASFSTTVTNSIATKLPLGGGTMTGNISHASNFTLDVGGELILDADTSGVIRLKDGGTEYGTLFTTSSNFYIKSQGNDKDIIFQGNDSGGSGFTALTLDMSAAGAATFNSTVTANNGINVDNINIDGTTIALSSGNLTLDVAGNINLDADGGSVTLKDGGASFGTLFKSSNNLIIYSTISDGDIKFQGNDGGSDITALTLDMSAAGKATFNAGAVFANNTVHYGNGSAALDWGNTSTVGQLSFSGTNAIIRSSVSDSDMIFQGNDGGSFITALTLDMSDAGTAIFNHNIKLPDNGGVTFGAGSDLSIYSDGTNGVVNVTNGNLTLDVAGELNIDVDGGAINYKDGGTHFASLEKSGDSLRFETKISDGDIQFRGNDGGSIITALTLDMSDGGTASFNHDVKLGDVSQLQMGASSDFQIFHNGTNNYIKNATSNQDLIIQGNDGGSIIDALTLDMSEAGAATFNGAVNIPGFIKHVGDDNSFFGFPGGDEFRVELGGVERMSMNGNETTFNEDGVNRNFRVESDDNANMLHVDGGNNGVGIGTAGTSTASLTFGQPLAGDQAIKIATGRNDAITDGLVFIDITDSNAPFAGLQVDHAGTGDAIKATGKIRATSFYGDGSNLTGVGSTTAGAVGTYILSRPENFTTYNAGDTVAGSTLADVGSGGLWASFSDGSGGFWNPTDQSSASSYSHYFRTNYGSGTTKSGTWRCMSKAAAFDNGSGSYKRGIVGLWVRIS